MRAKRRAALAQLDTLTQAIFLEMFGDPINNPKGWPLQTLGDVIDLITYGLTVRPEYHPVGIPLISAKEIRSGSIDYRSASMISEVDFLRLSDKAKPKYGDVLFSKTGSIGHCASVEDETRIALAQNVARLVFRESIVNQRYAMCYLRCRSIQNLAQREARGNAVKDLQLGVMERFPFPLPNLHLQQLFACRGAAVEQLKLSHRASLAQLDELFASLQHRAFRGEL